MASQQDYYVNQYAQAGHTDEFLNEYYMKSNALKEQKISNMQEVQEHRAGPIHRFHDSASYKEYPRSSSSSSDTDDLPPRRKWKFWIFSFGILIAFALILFLLFPRNLEITVTGFTKTPLDSFYFDQKSGLFSLDTILKVKVRNQNYYPLDINSVAIRVLELSN